MEKVIWKLDFQNDNNQVYSAILQLLKSTLCAWNAKVSAVVRTVKVGY